jgi:hypothetical protein
MKQGSRSNFVLSSLYHTLRPQAFFLLNKLGYQLLPNATNCFWKASILVCGESVLGPDTGCWLLLFYCGRRECNVVLFFRHAGAVYCLKNLFMLKTNMISFQQYTRIVLWGSTVHRSNSDLSCFVSSMSVVRIPVLSPIVLSFVLFVQTSQSDVEECCKTTCNHFIKHPLNSLATVQVTSKFSGFHWTFYWSDRRLSYYTW